jgi:probable F420-dependent oxidoreductase
MPPGSGPRASRLAPALTRAFRFIAPMPRLEGSPESWRDAVRRVEGLGFDTVSVSDHFTRGWVMEPTSALLAAAEATERLRVLSLVLGNDYRHPVLLHKTAATIDFLSGGRLELGLGAGWMRSDYEAAGIPYDPPGVRLARLEESLQVIKGLFGPEPLTFQGEHYRITELEGLPKPVQTPHPPLLVGGGGKRVLGIAARRADVVSVHCNLRSGEVDADAAADLSAERVAEKVGWVEEAAREAGRSLDEIELQFTTYLCHVTDAPQAAGGRSSFANLLAADAELVEHSPSVLVGTVSECVEKLQERRERYGFSYLNLGADVENVAPLVARLAGT